MARRRIVATPLGRSLVSDAEGSWPVGTELPPTRPEPAALRALRSEPMDVTGGCCVSPDDKAGSSKGRITPCSSITFHFTIPSPSTTNPFEIPRKVVLVLDLNSSMKSFLSGEMEIEAPVSQIKGNLDDDCMFLNVRNDAVDKS